MLIEICHEKVVKICMQALLISQRGKPSHLESKLESLSEYSDNQNRLTNKIKGSLPQTLLTGRHDLGFDFARDSREVRGSSTNHVTLLPSSFWSAVFNHESNMAVKVVAKTAVYSRARCTLFQRLIARLCSSKAAAKPSRVSFVSNGCSTEELEDIQHVFSTDFEVHDDFITHNEESALMAEVEPYLKRLPYQYDHWDDVSRQSRFNSLKVLLRHLQYWVDETLPVCSHPCLFTAFYFFVGVEGRAQRITRDLDASTNRRGQGEGRRLARKIFFSPPPCPTPRVSLRWKKEEAVNSLDCPIDFLFQMYGSGFKVEVSSDMYNQQWSLQLQIYLVHVQCTESMDLDVLTNK